MNDLTILHDAWDTPDAPSAEAHAAARTALLERAAAPRPPARRRTARGLRLALAGALALAIATAVLVAENLGDDRLHTLPTASAEVLERAASAAEQKPFTAPRDDQWIYIEDRFSGTDGTRVSRSWKRADGRALATLVDGKLRVERFEPLRKRGRLVPGPLDSFKEAAALPADPNAVLRWAYEMARHTTGTGTRGDDGDVYAILNHLLRENLLPPNLEAAIFRALKQVPGVGVASIDLAGRPVISLAMDTSSWLREELLLDQSTYAYRGERSTVTRDAKINPLKAGNATGEIEKGHVVVVERLHAKIVDEAGDRG